MRAGRLVQSSSEILGGTPVIRGTRIGGIPTTRRTPHDLPPLALMLLVFVPLRLPLLPLLPR